MGMPRVGGVRARQLNWTVRRAGSCKLAQTEVEITQSVMEGVHASQSQSVVEACIAQNTAPWEHCAVTASRTCCRPHPGNSTPSMVTRDDEPVKRLSDSRRKSTSHGFYTKFQELRRFLTARLRGQTAAYLSPVTRRTDTGPRALHVGGSLGRRAAAGS